MSPHRSFCRSFLSHMGIRLLTFSLLLANTVVDVRATPTTRTIDDYYGDSSTGAMPVYTNTSDAEWNYGPDCPPCSLRPDTDKAFKGSWHDTTLLPNAAGANVVSMSFTGTEVWVYCIMAQKVNSTAIITATDIDIELDGEKVKTYVNIPTNLDATTGDFSYNVTVYDNTNLTNMEHTLKMTVLAGSWIAFDYLQYTYDSIQVPAMPVGPATSGTSSSSSNSESSTTFTTSSNGDTVTTSASSVKPASSPTTIITPVSGLRTTVTSSVLVTPSPLPSLTSPGGISVPPDNPTKSHPSIAAIVGAAAGGAAAVVLLSIILCVCRRQRSKRVDRDRRLLARVRTSPVRTGEGAYLAVGNPAFATSECLDVHCTDITSPTLSVDALSRSMQPIAAHTHFDDTPGDFTTSYSPTTTIDTSSSSHFARIRTAPSGGPLPGLEAETPQPQPERYGDTGQATGSATITYTAGNPQLTYQQIIESQHAISTTVDVSDTPIAPPIQYDVSALQRQIGALQRQVNDMSLRADRVSLDTDIKAPPPAYEEAGDREG
ncbi:uncharacterized protein B0H18DRAFT_685913 [Fomitopsis serialis]|uniref:uncharacterized protein n=1 Tax=Fomitopsis serialis TaxID=139415 RepID=UPI0020081422|nr:uncharacterized protein B0H18DRAFT_685913 [Neoantrodia serialis]KAH9917971.1 hypothetical protein B0H18DRAFT_685913 [Neoantrodia serialis]